MIETSQFQTLVAVAKEKSFSRAAESLGVTQSAISQSIKSLESKIEVQLFKRSGKSVVLTSEGEKLNQLAVGFLKNLELTIEEIRYNKNEMTGKIRVGTLTGIGKSWLAPELLQFTSEYPSLSVATSLGFPEELIRDFEDYKLDLLVLPEYALPHQGEKVLLCEERSTLVMPKSDQYNIEGDVTLEKISQLPVVLFDLAAPIFLKWCQECFGRTPKKFTARYVINSHGNMLQAVIQGLGIAVVPTHVLNRSVYKNKVKTLGKKYEVSNGKFYLVYHENALELVRIKTLVDRLVSGSIVLSSDNIT
ncbi:MAG: LysR family transcriptional regulator [Bacteriovoracaceae bacterium]|nr:LysR family transcriptional regulator [Bacteriovoracaceae bacterium]